MTTSEPMVRQRPPRGDARSERLVDAALSCFAEFGVSKTTLDDVASAACCSRATVYRYFPGKQALVRGVVEAETRRLARELDAVASRADDLEELVVGVLVHVGREVEGHRALEHVLAVEPELLLPHMAFDGAERLFAVASMLVGPLLTRHLPEDEAPGTAEWLARLALSYVCGPSEHVSLVDEDSVRRLVRTFVLPGLRGVAATPAPAAPARTPSTVAPPISDPARTPTEHPTRSSRSS